MKFKCYLLAIIGLMNSACTEQFDARKIKEPVSEAAGIPSLETGLLSVEYQAALLEELNAVFNSPEHRRKEIILKKFGANGDYIRTEGEDGTERFLFTFHVIEDAVDKLMHEFSEINYLAGFTVVYKDGEYLYWEPRYKTRFRG